MWQTTSTHPCMEEGGDVGPERKEAKVVEKESVGRREELMDMLEGEIGGSDNGARVYDANSRLRAMASKREVERILGLSLSRIVEEGMQEVRENKRKRKNMMEAIHGASTLQI
ncbi:hypothetical protein SESBI_42307 [Sesbania bispinosa]|nr:hypothetical protein SESBI_42307 [Sesbania bispinosa]